MFTTGDDNSRYKTFTRRVAILGGAQAFAFTILAGRMYYLQVVRSEEYRMLADENRINVRLLAPLRGRIVDRFGKELASNRQNYRAVLIPEQTPDVADTLDKLARIVEITPFERKRILRDIARSPRFLPLTVAENLTWDQFAQININEPDLPGIQPDVGETRFYPYTSELAHLVGYVGPISEKELKAQDVADPLLTLPGFRIGKNGIEKTYDNELRGTAGSSHVEVNAYGRVIRELSKDPGKPGQEVVLTIDMELQQFTWDTLKDESASAVVMDIHSGDVLSFVSSPAYDPNEFNKGLSQALWKSLVENPYKPLTNKAVAGLYPPGSTFKIAVAAAALEAGIDPESTVHCSGAYWLGNHAFHCWRKEGHGTMNMHNAIKNSCDCYFYDVAKRIGIEQIAATARKFGFGETHDFGIPGEKAGLVPTPAWRKATSGEAWQQGETVITGIGQGFLQTTPLQLAVMAARLSNGGKAVKPRLTRALGGNLLPVPEAKSLGFDPAHLDIVMGGMNGVSNEPGGTAYRSRITEVGMELAGKTGTAQVRRISKAERDSGVIKNDKLDWIQRDHALFVCFAPVAKPRYAMSLVIEHGGSGSGAAAPLARDIMRQAQLRNPEQQAAYVPNSAPNIVKQEKA